MLQRALERTRDIRGAPCRSIQQGMRMLMRVMQRDGQCLSSTSTGTPMITEGSNTVDTRIGVGERIARYF